jgi:hypothetical protein
LRGSRSCAHPALAHSGTRRRVFAATCYRKNGQSTPIRTTKFYSSTQSIRRVSRQDDAKMPGSFRLLRKRLRVGQGIVHTPKRAVGDPGEP